MLVEGMGLGCVVGWRGGGKEDVEVVLERMFLEVSRCRGDDDGGRGGNPCKSSSTGGGFYFCRFYLQKCVNINYLCN